MIAKLGRAYLHALRPRQWPKNLVVFAAPLFAFNLNPPALWSAVTAFGLFCAASSSFYLFNDIADVAADRQHPVKCHRPSAAGLVRVPVAIAMALVLLATALIGGWLKAPALGLTLATYAGLQVAYNLKLKRVVILDIIVIAAGFVLRAIAGGVASGILPSVWFLLCTAMLALFLAIEKRKAELRLGQHGGKTRAVLQQYSATLLARMESTVTTGAVMSYAIWSSGPQVNGASTPWMMLTLPFVLYGIFRYQLLSDPLTPDHTAPQRTERPEEVLLTDRPLLITVGGWVLTVFAILWLKHQGYLALISPYNANIMMLMSPIN